MKAMMSEKLRNILNDPIQARELQKQLSGSIVNSAKKENSYEVHHEKPVVKSNFNAKNINKGIATLRKKIAKRGIKISLKEIQAMKQTGRK